MNPAEISLNAPKHDLGIRDGILAYIAQQSWSADAAVDVEVRDGTVYLWGIISDVAQREAFKVLVENTPGVKRLEDHVIRRSYCSPLGLVRTTYSASIAELVEAAK